MIDAAVMYPSQEQMNHAFHTCGVFSTLAFFMYVLTRLVTERRCWRRDARER